MSFKKAIESGKEKRKEWPFNKRVDKRCRNHGGCDWCLGNRIHKYKKQIEKAKVKE